MSYRAHRRLHPYWPRLVREWEGRLVELPRVFETKGGIRFDEGTILLVTSVYRGRLNLSDSHRLERARLIFKVRPEDVRLLPVGFPGEAQYLPDGYTKPRRTDRD